MNEKPVFNLLRLGKYARRFLYSASAHRRVDDLRDSTSALSKVLFIQALPTKVCTWPLPEQQLEVAQPRLVEGGKQQYVNVRLSPAPTRLARVMFLLLEPTK